MTTAANLTYLQTAFAAFQDNADFRSTGSTTKANAFIAAGLQLLAFPESGSLGGTAGEQFKFNKQAVQFAVESATKWLSTQQGRTSRIMHERFCRE